ncbi:MAG: hypothetical protein A3G18_05725 [Rhodospirillales bacterium RIFCSPLOWO2_12_FULL_58_28]|nr:MAG: hypothetical protein A3H92_00030 [Rhodospirillales bacterium RIFCSPLOWO2_02_FULL_58_16]OHC79284.1 MAG: hypothetical protein A3G18_05725 [Rhodospirillales bacterium RIFCSPLOWO2_12_FULL_58_28]
MSIAYQLCSDGAPSKIIREFAVRHGLDILDAAADGPPPINSARHGPGDAKKTTLIKLLADIDENRLAEALNPQIRACLEASAAGINFNRELLPVISQSNIFLSLTTATAYKIEVARHFSRWLAKHLNLSEDILFGLELSLQEALANGILHGNMGLKKTLPDDYHDLAPYGEMIRSKLNDLEHGQLHIEISARWGGDFIEMSVLDHGAGFDINAPIKKGITGWGLSLIRKMAETVFVTDGGRKITMRFAR